VSLVTLDQVHQHLRIPAQNTDDDLALNLFISAADEVIRFHTDYTVPKTFDEYYDGGNSAIYLRQKPVLSVTRVEEGWGWINWELDYVQVNSPPGSLSMFAYSIDIPETAKISRRTAGNIAIPFMVGQSNIRVVYTAGRESVPPVLQLASLELIAHWYQNSQQRGSGFNNPYDSTAVEFTRVDQGGSYSILAGVPYRILELIRPWRRDPIFA
jgi:hypothetical protein